MIRKLKSGEYRLYSRKKDPRTGRRRNLRLQILAICVGWLAGVMTAAQGPAPIGTTGAAAPASATANLIDAQGRNIGEARLQQTPHGVLLKLDLRSAPPGIHGMHIHDVGTCAAPSFESAGGHFNPSGHQHGFLNPRGPHTGDLPNIEVPPTTNLSMEYMVADVTLEPGSLSLLDANGSAIVIHAGKDDHASDPAGASGNRLACGGIVRSDTR